MSDAEIDVSHWHRVTRPSDGRKFEKEWEAQYLGVSTLTKKTAGFMALRLMREGAGEEGVPPYLGFRGNTMADGLTRPVTPHREICVDVPDFFAPGWSFRGHIDAIVDGGGGALEFVEVKTHPRATPRNVNAAWQQDACYAGLFAVAPTSTFHPADYADEDARAWTRPLGWDGSCALTVAILGHLEDEFFPSDLSGDEALRVLDFYRRKGRAVLRSYLAFREDGLSEDEALAVDGGALEWDNGREGILEATWRPDLIPTFGDGAAAAAANNFHDAREGRLSAGKRGDLAEVELKAFLAGSGVRDEGGYVTARVGNWLVSAKVRDTHVGEEAYTHVKVRREGVTEDD